MRSMLLSVAFSIPISTGLPTSECRIVPFSRLVATRALNCLKHRRSHSSLSWNSSNKIRSSRVHPRNSSPAKSSKAVTHSEPVQSEISTGRMNFWLMAWLQLPQQMQREWESADFLHLGLLQAPQCHLPFTLRKVTHTSSSLCSDQEALMQWISSSRSFTDLHTRSPSPPSPARPADIELQRISRSSQALQGWSQRGRISDLNTDPSDSRSRYLLSLKFFSTTVCRSRFWSSSMFRFHRISSMLFRLSGSPSSPCCLQMVRPSRSMERSSPSSRRMPTTSYWRSQTPTSRSWGMVREGSLGVGTHSPRSLSSVRRLRGLRMMVWREWSWSRCWLQVFSLTWPFSMRQRVPVLTVLKKPLACSPNRLASILVMVLSISWMLHTFISLSVLLLNSLYDLSITRTISFHPGKSTYRSDIFSYSLKCSSWIVSGPSPDIIVDRLPPTISSEQSWGGEGCSRGSPCSCWLQGWGRSGGSRGVQETISRMRVPSKLWVTCSVTMMRYLGSLPKGLPILVMSMKGCLMERRALRVRRPSVRWSWAMPCRQEGVTWVTQSTSACACPWGTASMWLMALGVSGGLFMFEL